MNNEPVAWMVEKDGDVSFIMNGTGLTKPDGSWDKVTPVYTLKDLTNDEIMQVAMATSWSYQNWGYFQIDFARAIIEKAQGK